jgi:hypothetical protein
MTATVPAVPAGRPAYLPDGPCPGEPQTPHNVAARLLTEACR